LSKPKTVEMYDLIIVGGGMVGAALACAVADAGLHVSILETKEPQRSWPDDEVDLRVSALTRASQRMLENLYAWPRMAQMRISPYTEMEVWDAEGSGRIHFSAAEIGEPDLGHIVENRITQLALWERLEMLPNVTIRCPTVVAELQLGQTPGDQLPGVVLQDGEQLSSKLIVAADGRDSQLRGMADIGTQGWDYDQHAIVATVKPTYHHQQAARQRFMPRGPLALLPINDGRCSIVWSTSPKQADELMALSDALFCDQLTRASEAVLGEIVDVGPRGLFPLPLGHAETYCRPGFVLVGDAAHAMHPLAGQGVNLGFMDAMTLADVIIEAYRAGRAIGSFATLRRYERARKGPNIAMLAAMDAFKRIFSNDVIPLKLMRNLGLDIANRSGVIKYQLIRRAMGMSGELPSLAR
jgi:2-octaprenylphenol hydroxylase